LKEILWSAERVVAARSTKDTDRFRWRNAFFLVDQISIPPPVAPPVAETSNNPPKKYKTRNKGKKTNVWLDIVHSSQVAQPAAFDMINTGGTTTFATGGSSNP
ncbi:27741_t:CDS:2, partial [Racocetra persica]